MNQTEKPIRWWPLAIIVTLTILAVVFIWMSEPSQRQQQVLKTVEALFISFLFILLWLLFFSRLRWKIRIISLAVIGMMAVLSVALFRVRGFSGDLVPILEWRWTQRSPAESVPTALGKTDETSWLSPHDYPQFLGPQRNATVRGIKLVRDWSKHPPRLLWRQPIGEGWSAFAVVGDSAITQAQYGEWEQVVCYDLKSGEVKWRHRDHDRYESALAGVGPRATPTIVKDRVYILGGTGILNCLDLGSGEQIWSEDILYDNNAEINPW
ncbi:MAG: PQQ-binding-like beta-propeller repeat protein [Candidatus Poribacteria bacterium]|nr:PQQ-binding-like beta-propeller repeat protein [Candidatus Poribacteria bacterium]